MSSRPPAAGEHVRAAYFLRSTPDIRGLLSGFESIYDWQTIWTTSRILCSLGLPMFVGLADLALIL
jgi:hypothetical protein